MEENTETALVYGHDQLNTEAALVYGQDQLNTEAALVYGQDQLNTEAALVYGQDQLNRLHLNDIFNTVAYSVMSLGKIQGALIGN